MTSLLTCAECGATAPEKAAGWRAFRADQANEDEEPEVVLLCPKCAEREFGRTGKSGPEPHSA
jgi:hypothetical protein